MDTVYTTTITDQALKRGISVEVIDYALPIFLLSYKGKSIRCCNSLTDKVGAVTFNLANNKSCANWFLRNHGFRVPAQTLFTSIDRAKDFLSANKCIVVKPCSQWGGRGVSTHITSFDELKKALTFARKFSDDIVLEEYVKGVDWRLIFVDYQFTAAIQRNPAVVEGNGTDSVRTLIRKRNNAVRRLVDTSNTIPLDKETRRCLLDQGLSYDTIPGEGEIVAVRRTTNFHTGGTVDIITDSVHRDLIDTAGSIAKLFELPVVGIDLLIDPLDKSYYIIEVSPDMAISPPEGDVVASAFLDYLFPETISDSKVLKKSANKEELEVSAL